MASCPIAEPGRPSCRHRPRHLERAVIALWVWLVAACDPAYGIHLAVVPARRPQNDSLALSGLAVVSHVAARHGLSPMAPPDKEIHHWTHCFGERGITLCAKADASQMEFFLSQFRAFRRFTPTAERLRRELLDSLASRFGSGAIRECDVRYQKTADSNWWRKSYRAICVPRAVADSSR